MRAVCLGVAMLVGCATAGKDGNGFNNGGIDAPAGTQHDAPGPTPDGSHPDAAPSVDGMVSPQEITLTQTGDNTVTVGDSVTCSSSAGGWSVENSWYRLFSPSAAGVTGVFHVEHVDFAVQEASGTQQVQINVGTYGGTVGGSTASTAQMTKLANAQVSVPATSTGELLSATVAADIPAGASMYVEIFSPTHINTTTYFFVGASASAETSPGYIRAPDCGAGSPTSMKVVGGAGAGALILTVTGTH